jgi:hypothetical protein
MAGRCCRRGWSASAARRGKAGVRVRRAARRPNAVPDRAHRSGAEREPEQEPRGGIRDGAGPGIRVVRRGLTHKPGQDYVFATMVQRRYIAILQCAAVAIGVPALFADKKPHAFRAQVLGSTRASEAERECQPYRLAEHGAEPPFREPQAHRHECTHSAGRDDQPHPFRQCLALAQAPGDGYWQRVRRCRLRGRN